MAISLYDLSVVNYLQTLGAIEGFLAKGPSRTSRTTTPTPTRSTSVLCADMAPFKLPDRGRRRTIRWAPSTASRRACSVRPGHSGSLDYAGLQKA